MMQVLALMNHLSKDNATLYSCKRIPKTAFEFHCGLFNDSHGAMRLLVRHIHQRGVSCILLVADVG